MSQWLKNGFRTGRTPGGLGEALGRVLEGWTHLGNRAGTFRTLNDVPQGTLERLTGLVEQKDGEHQAGARGQHYRIRGPHWPEIGEAGKPGCWYEWVGPVRERRAEGTRAFPARRGPWLPQGRELISPAPAEGHSRSGSHKVRGQEESKQGIGGEPPDRD